MKVQIEYPKPNEHLKSSRYIIKVSGIDCNNIRIAIDDDTWRQCYYSNSEWCYNWLIDREGKHMIKAECWNKQGERLETSIFTHYDINPPKEEEKPEKQEITAVKSDFMRAEVNFLQYPIGVLDQHFKGKTFTFKEIIPADKGDIAVSWKILGTDEYGLPGPTAVELDMAITKLISDQYEKEKKYSIWYRISYCELCEIMNKNYTSRFINETKRDLKKLCTTSYESSFAFKTKGQSPKFPPVLISRKYDSIVLKGETVPSQVPEEELTEKERKSEKKEADYIYIVLSPVYLASLQAHYTKPVYYEFTKNLSSAVSKRVFQLLSLKFATDMKKDPDDKECINYNYIKFCGQLPLKIWTIKWRAEQQLTKYFDQLGKQNYLEKYIFEFTDNQKKPLPPDRWFIRFYPGASARDELDYCTGQLFLWDIFTKTQQQKQLETSASQIPNMFAQQQAQQQAEYEQDQKDLKEWNEWKAKINLLPEAEKAELKQQAIKNQQANRQTVTNLGTEIEMINIYKCSQ